MSGAGPSKRSSRRVAVAPNTAAAPFARWVAAVSLTRTPARRAADTAKSVTFCA